MKRMLVCLALVIMLLPSACGERGVSSGSVAPHGGASVIPECAAGETIPYEHPDSNALTSAQGRAATVS